jgi:hypothetical protein
MYLKRNYFLQDASSETVNFLRPFLRRAARTLRPFAVLIRLRKPCLFLRLRNEGWNVRFILYSFIHFLREGKDRKKLIYSKLN